MNIKKAVDYILNEVDIVEYTINIMNFSYKKYGRNLRTICPLHKDSDPSLTVTIGKQVWHCFGCKAGGSIITLVEKYNDINKIQAINKILDDLSIDKIQFQDGKEEIVESGIMNSAQYFFKDKAENSSVFKEYFSKKGYKDIGQIINIGIGYGSTKEELVEYLISQKYNEEEIWTYDLDNDRFNNSIIYPIYNQYGNISYFRCRMLGSEIKCLSSNINIPTYNDSIFLGIHSLKNADYVIIVEGDSDWLAL
jgi:DNA primase